MSECQPIFYDRRNSCEVCGEQCGTVPSEVDGEEDVNDPRPWIGVGGIGFFPGGKENGIAYEPIGFVDADGDLHMSDWLSIHEQCWEAWRSGIEMSRPFRHGRPFDR